MESPDKLRHYSRIEQKLKQSEIERKKKTVVNAGLGI